MVVETGFLDEVFRDERSSGRRVEERSYPSYRFFSSVGPIGISCASSSGRKADTTVRVAWVSSNVFRRISAGLDVEDAADPIDADLTGVSLGISFARGFLNLQGAEIEVGRTFRASVGDSFRRG